MDKPPISLAEPAEAVDLPAPRQESTRLRGLARLHKGLFIIALLFALHYAQALVLPVVVAILLTLLLSPCVRAQRRIGIPEPLGAGIVVLALLAVVGTGVYRLAEPAISWVQMAPRGLNELESKVRKLTRPVQEVKEATEKVEAIAAMEDGKGRPREVVVKGPGLSGIVATNTQKFVTAAVSCIVLLYFLLASGDLFLRKTVRILSRFRDKVRAVEAGREIQRQIGRYFFAMACSSTGLGIATAIAMQLLGLPNPVLWGVLATVLNFIPYVGSMFTTLILTLAAILAFDEVRHIWPVPVVFIVLTTIEGQLVQPIVAGRHLSLNPVLVFGSLLFWGWMWGVAGLLIAVPLLVMFKIICDHVDHLNAVGDFLGRD